MDYDYKLISKINPKNNFVKIDKPLKKLPKEIMQPYPMQKKTININSQKYFNPVNVSEFSNRKIFRNDKFNSKSFLSEMTPTNISYNKISNMTSTDVSQQRRSDKSPVQNINDKNYQILRNKGENGKKFIDKDISILGENNTWNCQYCGNCNLSITIVCQKCYKIKNNINDLQNSSENFSNFENNNGITDENNNLNNNKNIFQNLNQSSNNEEKKLINILSTKSKNTNPNIRNIYKPNFNNFQSTKNGSSNQNLQTISKELKSTRYKNNLHVLESYKTKSRDKDNKNRDRSQDRIKAQNNLTINTKTLTNLCVNMNSSKEFNTVKENNQQNSYYRNEVQTDFENRRPTITEENSDITYDKNKNKKIKDINKAFILKNKNNIINYDKQIETLKNTISLLNKEKMNCIMNMNTIGNSNIHEINTRELNSGRESKINMDGRILSEEEEGAESEDEIKIIEELEKEIREKKQEINKQEKEFESLKNKTTMLKLELVKLEGETNNNSLEEEILKYQNMNNKCNKKIKELEEEIENKNQNIDQIQKEIEYLNKEMSTINSSNNSYKSEYAALKEKNNQCENELKKLNDLIRDLLVNKEQMINDYENEITKLTNLYNSKKEKMVREEFNEEEQKIIEQNIKLKNENEEIKMLLSDMPSLSEKYEKLLQQNNKLKEKYEQLKNAGSKNVKTKKKKTSIKNDNTNENEDKKIDKSFKSNDIDENNLEDFN